MVGQQCGGVQDPSLRPSLRDVDEELTQLMAEQSAVNDTLAEKRKRDQALLEQMLPPQVSKPLAPCHPFNPPAGSFIAILFWCSCRWQLP